ncbi:MAG: GNAT family N-acetyltransferase [Ruminococcus sp.]|nr:GNAT family N-acetyltransferase [Ruminococcus sp.]MDE6833152.1 GNAT family N-acetyltransferase [Ruminococcus sp.]
MIRKFCGNDINRVMNIWFEANMDSHNFVNPEYWKEKYNEVKSMIPQAEVYIYESDGIIKGFIGLDGDYIAGIFVDKIYRSEGIGTALIRFIKNSHERLILSVYEKNKSAVRFYEKSGFVVASTGTDSDTLQTEYTMLWERTENK